MIINVVSSSGIGKTKLSAFDDALCKSGVANFNLIALSSIIPLKAEVRTIKKYNPDPKQMGQRLYVVMANSRTTHEDSFIGAALGWYYLKSGGGVFVEHSMIDGYSEEKVKERLTGLVADSISDLCVHRNELFDRKKMNISMSVSHPDTRARCALVVAVYQPDPWCTYQ